MSVVQKHITAVWHFLFRFFHFKLVHYVIISMIALLLKI